MSYTLKLFTILLSAVIVFSSCNKSYKCVCAGGTVFEEFEKEIRAPNKKKAREQCEADNQPPTTPDIVNCGLKH